jgi:hypothetical protein
VAGLVSERGRRRADALTLLPFVLAAALLTAAVSRTPFFWDTVQLGSKQAHWFFDNGFRKAALPPEIDSGHPPTFGAYLALVWTLFGRTLVASHLAMLPFLIGIVLALYALVKRFVPAERARIGLLFLLVEPTLLAQSVLVSPDIVLVFFYLLSLNACLGQRRKRLAAPLVALSLVSLRGMLSVLAIAVTDLALHVAWRRPGAWRRALRLGAAYLPAAALASGWLAWHHAETGWIGHHPDSPWAESFARVGPFGMLRNVGYLAWRLLDFGRVFLWLASTVLFVRAVGRGGPRDPRLRTLAALFLAPLIVYAPSLVAHAHLTGHRYLLMVYVLFSLFVFCQLEWIARRTVRRWVTAALFAGLLTGHLWRYPESIAMGWDSTLAHVPYHGLRARMIGYIEGAGISPARVGSDFPNLASPRIIDLSNETWSFHAKNLATDEYVFYASVFNGFTDDELRALRERWTVEKEFGRLGLRATLYRRPE